ncbi:hypothetical protein VPH35_120840 [Triticum aestivum]
MLAISATNSRSPCLDSCDTLFTAISKLDAERRPLYTLPNPPTPSKFLSVNPSVARCRSLYAYRWGPNSSSQPSRTSANRRRRHRKKKTAASAVTTSNTLASGKTMARTLDRGLGPRRGRAGSLEKSSGGAGPSKLKLHPSR